jgi:hypothetical protein
LSGETWKSEDGRGAVMSRSGVKSFARAVAVAKATIAASVVVNLITKDAEEEEEEEE